MKKSSLSTALALSLAVSAFAEPPKTQYTARQWYQAGMAAVKAGKPDNAKIAFERALKIDPRFTPAKYQLSRLPDLKLETIIAKRKALFKSTIIKEIDFNEAGFDEALEALNEMAVKASKDEFSPNFVVQDPGEKLGKQKVTLKMKNVPLSAALDYLLEAAGAKARYDEFATVIRPAAK
jgi:tetratricopeptide (TPR) repeat protein